MEINLKKIEEKKEEAVIACSESSFSAEQKVNSNKFV